MVEQVSAGKWHLSVSVRQGKTVTRATRTMYGTAKAARDAEALLKDEVRRRQGSLIAQSKLLSFRQAYDIYRQDKPGASWPACTVNKLLEYCGAMKLNEGFDMAFGRAWKLYKERNTRYGSRPSRSASNKFLSLARVVLNHCRKFKVLRDEFLTQYQPSAERGRDRYLSNTEVLAVCMHLPTWAFYLAWCSYRTGCRAGELRALRKKHVDNLHGFFMVRCRKGRDERTRTIPIPDDLRTYFNDCGDIVFPCEGRPVTKDGLGHAWARACDAAGIADAHFHDLRGAAATNLAIAGQRQAVIDRLLGHSTRAMAERYQKVIGDAELVAAINKKAPEKFAQKEGVTTKVLQFTGTNG